MRHATMDTLRAFVQHAPLGDYGPARSDAPLSGMTLAVKDLFDVRGLRTGAGTPAWLDGPGRLPAARDATAVARLRDAGARIIGKTLTDELAWSLNGENAHYGTPENPAAAGRIPGGSSAGSAAAVAGGVSGIGLGTDTGGSVRLPASYCGIWGFRPTHGRISLTGVVALSPSYDTVGWFASDPDTLRTVGTVFFGTSDPPRPTGLLIARDLFDRVPETYRDGLLAEAGRLARLLGLPTREVVIAPEGIGEWRAVFRICQSAEVWDTHGAWIEAERPAFGPGIADRFQIAASLEPEVVAAARKHRAEISSKLSERLRGGAILLVPGGGGPPPLRGCTGPDLEDIRNRALDVLCPAGHAGLPQLAFPALTTGEGPLGLGLVGASGTDEALLQLAPSLKAAE